MDTEKTIEKLVKQFGVLNLIAMIINSRSREEVTVEVKPPWKGFIIEERKGNPMGENISYVLQLIKRRGDISRSDLLRSLTNRGVTAAMVTEAIDSLKLGGFIHESSNRNSCSLGRPETVYHYIKNEFYAKS